MPTETVVLAWSVVLLLAHIFLQSGLKTLQTGLAYNAGARDEGQELKSVYAGRAQRALRNFLETYPAFLALALALAAIGRTGGYGPQGAIIWIAARIIYVPLYLAGVPYLRTFAWLVSLWGLFRMFEQLLWP